MKYLSVLFLCLIFGWGNKMQVVVSTSQEWAGGLQESGYGTDYKLTVKVKAGSDVLRIDELWVGDTHMKVRVVADPANPQITAFKKGSHITVKAGVTIKPVAGLQINSLAPDSIARPFNFKGEGLLGYTYKGRKAYLEIAEFKKLEKIIYP